MAARRIFISYARADGEQFAEALYNELSEESYDVWWDREALRSRGAGFLQEIRDAIDKVDRVLLVVTPGAIESPYVEKEWRHALSICKVVIPLLRIGKGNNDDKEDYPLIPAPVGQANAIDFRVTRPHFEAMKQLKTDFEAEDKPLGRKITVPDLPANYLLREEPIAAVKEKLLADIHSTAVISGRTRNVGVQGMGGIGKSVLAMAMAHDCEVRRAFPDGIFWLSIGQNPQLAVIQANLGEGLGANPRNFVNVEEGKRILSQLLVDRQCLLVLDDVWKPQHADAFAVANENSKLLITTRSASVTHAMGVTPYELGLLRDDQARELLASWAAVPVPELPEEADAIIDECGNLPLGITLIGAMIARNPNSWGRALRRLQKADLEKIRNDFPDYPYPDLMKALHVSVEDLPDDVQERYIDFAVFQEDVSIPGKVLHTFWGPLDLDGDDSDEILDKLVTRPHPKDDQSASERSGASQRYAPSRSRERL